MKRLVLGLAITIALAGILASSAHAAALSMKEVKSAAVEYGSTEPKFDYPFVYFVRDCSRLAPNRVRCSIGFTIETYWKLKHCKSRVEITKEKEVRGRTVGTKCRKDPRPFLSVDRAEDVALEAINQNPRNGTILNYGKARYEFYFSWDLNGEVCSQIARVRLLDGKAVVSLSEVSCVATPPWPAG
jgi:hypothetical protein